MRDQEVLDLYEAYASIYASQEEVVEEVEELDEAYEPISRERENRMYRRAGNLARTALSSTGKKKKEAQKKSSTIVGVITRQKERERFNEIGKSPTHNEELDLYDIILSHLLDEGYADTNEAALVIMANMSEEWRQSIVEELEQLDEISLKTKIKAYAATQDPEADYRYGSKVHDQGDRIRKAIVKKHGEKAGEHADAHADSEHWGRIDPRTGKRQGYAKPRFQNPNKYRTTKAGKMHGQDKNALKAKLKKRMGKP